MSISVKAALPTPPTPDQVRAAHAAQRDAELAAEYYYYCTQIHPFVCETLMKATEDVDGILRTTAKMRCKVTSYQPWLDRHTVLLANDFPGWSIVPSIDMDSSEDHDYLVLDIRESTVKST